MLSAHRAKPGAPANRECPCRQVSVTYLGRFTGHFAAEGQSVLLSFIRLTPVAGLALAIANQYWGKRLIFGVPDHWLVGYLVLNDQSGEGLSFGPIRCLVKNNAGQWWMFGRGRSIYKQGSQHLLVPTCSKSVHLSRVAVCPSVRPSIRPSVRPRYPSAVIYSWQLIRDNKTSFTSQLRADCFAVIASTVSRCE